MIDAIFFPPKQTTGTTPNKPTATDSLGQRPRQAQCFRHPAAATAAATAGGADADDAAGSDDGQQLGLGQQGLVSYFRFRRRAFESKRKAHVGDIRLHRIVRRVHEGE